MQQICEFSHDDGGSLILKNPKNPAIYNVFIRLMLGRQMIPIWTLFELLSALYFSSFILMKSWLKYFCIEKRFIFVSYCIIFMIIMSTRIK